MHAKPGLRAGFSACMIIVRLGDHCRSVLKDSYVVLLNDRTCVYLSRTCDRVVYSVFRNSTSTVEPRLLGTWVSDADKTVEMMPKSTDTESEAFQKTRMLLGKMKISFSSTDMVIALDGQIDRIAYLVLDSDDYRVSSQKLLISPGLTKKWRTS